MAGVSGLVESALHRHEGVKVDDEDGGVAVELHARVEWGVASRSVGARGAAAASPTTSSRMADVAARRVDVVVDEFAAPRRRLVRERVAGLTGATLEHGAVRLPRLRLVAVARRARRSTRIAGSRRPRTTGARGAPSTATTTAACSARSSTGQRALFPRAADLPAGPPSDDAVLVTCAYLVGGATPWVEQSLFLAAIGEARDKGAKALEAFAYRYPEGESTYERFLVHRTVFPRDFLADFGFQHRPRAGQRRARAARARRPAAGRRGHAGECAAASSRRRSRPAHRCPSAATVLSGSGAVPVSLNVEPATGTKRQAYAPARSVSRSTPYVRSFDARSRAAGSSTG